MNSHRATTLSLVVLLTAGPLFSGCKEKPAAAKRSATLDQLHVPVGEGAPALSRELLEKYAKYREAYAELVAEVRTKEQERRASAKDSIARGAGAATATVRKSIEQLEEAARARAGLTKDEAEACRAMVSVVVTSGVVVDDKLQRLEAELAKAGPEAKKQLEESIALYREQKERLEERIAAAKKSHGDEAIELVDDLREVLAAAEKKVVEAGR